MANVVEVWEAEMRHVPRRYCRSGQRFALDDATHLLSPNHTQRYDETNQDIAGAKGTTVSSALGRPHGGYVQHG
jgi:hypothetical protein